MLRRALTAAATLAVVAAASGPPPALAAGPPVVLDGWAAKTSADAAELHGTVNPNGLATQARIQYVSAARYAANLAFNPPQDPFTGGSYSPPSGFPLGSGLEPASFSRPLGGLAPATAYRYRVLASNGAGADAGSVGTFTTTAGEAAPSLPDDRGWEMVSPVDKNGGEIQGPGGVLGGGLLQAAAAGGAFAYSSSASFGAAQGAPGASQYVARRQADGWRTDNVTEPSFPGGYGPEPDGVPFGLFDPALARGLFASPWACGAEPCPRGYGLLDLGSGAVSPSPSRPDLRVVAASEDLSTVLLSTCAKLTPNATEAPLGGGGCDPAQPNLYLWSGAALSLVNLLPGDATGTPGASVAASAGAVSADGSRVYFSLGGDLYLRQGGATLQVDATAGGGGAFQAASGDGSIAYFTKGAHLYRYAAGGAATDLAGGVIGVLGASPNGEHVYYLGAGGVQHVQGSTVIPLGIGAEASDYPPATATARVGADGNLAFLAVADWPGSDNAGHAQAFVYSPAGEGLACVSCNPTGVRSQGPAAIAAATVNGPAPNASSTYRPRALVAGGNRLFFESPDPLLSGDTNSARDVYEWEAQGVGSCERAGGCVALISSGRAEGGARFLDASRDGDDAYFLTARSLVEADPGAADVYVARVGGGFPVPDPPIPCLGDACQPIPGAPADPTLATAVPRPETNPPLKFARERAPGKSGCQKKRSGRRAKATKARCSKRSGKHAAKGSKRSGKRRR